MGRSAPHTQWRGAEIVLTPLPCLAVGGSKACLPAWEVGALPAAPQRVAEHRQRSQHQEQQQPAAPQPTPLSLAPLAPHCRRDSWDKAPDGGNYVLREPGRFMLREGQLLAPAHPAVLVVSGGGTRSGQAATRAAGPPVATFLSLWGGGGVEGGHSITLDNMPVANGLRAGGGVQGTLS